LTQKIKLRFIQRELNAGHCIVSNM